MNCFCCFLIFISLVITELIPDINVSNTDINIGNAIYDASIKTGFFYINNHGISTELQQQLLQQTKLFFDLNLGEKLKYQRNTTHWGYTPFGSEILNDNAHKETKESFYISLDEHCGNNCAKQSQMPSDSILPEFREITMKYIKQALNLGFIMNDYLSLSLGLPKEYFNNITNCFENPIFVLRLIHYNSELSNIDTGTFGASSHTDYGMLTLLLTDNVPGLQIYTNNEWTNIEYKENRFIINIGDALQIWTNGRYLATKHRVFISEKKDRYSAAFFFDPNYDCLVSCIPTICNDEISKYKPIKYGTYLTQKYQKILDNKYEL